MQPNATTLKIKVLKGLPLAIIGMGTQMFKLVETFSFLKAVYPEGRFSDMAKAATVVSSASLVNPKTFKRRISALITEKFLSKNPDGNYYLASWDAVAERFEISHQRFYHIESSNYVKLEYILRNKAEQEKEKQCTGTFIKRVRSNKVLQDCIQSVTGEKINPSTVADHQLNCYLSEGRGYSEDQSYALDVHFYKKDDKILRGDAAISYRKWTKLFNFKGHGSHGYWKKKLCQLGLRHIVKRKAVIAPGTNTTLLKRRNRLGYVFRDNEERKTYLIMPDQLVHHPLKGLDERYKQLVEIRAHLSSLDAKKAA